MNVKLNYFAVRVPLNPSYLKNYSCVSSGSVCYTCRCVGKRGGHFPDMMSFCQLGSGVLVVSVLQGLFDKGLWLCDALGHGAVCGLPSPLGFLNVVVAGAQQATEPACSWARRGCGGTV